MEVKRAYDTGTLTAGSTVATMQYDGVGRRIVKAITNSADWNATYHYYHEGQRVVETRNGSGQVLKQCVWGQMYVDELVQIGVNQDPGNAETETNSENECERFFWVLQDANYNVLGVVACFGRLIERYEYTPYGRRTVYSHGWLAADFSGDGSVDVDHDQSLLLANWSSTDAEAADLNADEIVNDGDSSLLGASYGDSLPTEDALVTHPALESPRGVVGSAGGITLTPHDARLCCAWDLETETHDE